ncbi:MauE/DoxX family redox-associated membrane protein [Jiangella asiatica]|uniref:Methylamine utilisation protein MauE domain-containing protein n=1 Tax=Jiangella asiatica TaxID=2530372 RepID=A0A4R5CN38_9ACTN|nr:MauE/DoxX family redox-associated membrane protein [Jiangella asiatica]TDE01809.1 hypothetical protein E1269_22635 [Jiangella asiatica]
MIGFVAEVARWALVLVFAVAVIGKVARPGGVAGLATTLRVGLRLPQARAGAWALVAAEAVVVVLLAVPATASAGLLGAGALAAALTAGAAVLARRTQALPCRCFGSASSTVTWASVVRNAVLTGLALGALAVPEIGDSGRTPAALATAAVVLLVLRWLALRPPANAPAGGEPVTLPPSGPDIGAPAPRAAGGVRLVAFASASCRGCRLALPRLVAYATVLGGRGTAVVTVVGDPAEAADIVAAVSDVASVVSGARADDLAAVYGVVLFPTYVLVSGDGLVEAVTHSVDELPRPVR